LECDEECLRLQRNRKLADALDIDPDTHSDDQIPYGDFTLRFFRENTKWAQEKEREFRDFAAAPEEKRLRFKPMPSHQRAFLHALAEDFGLDSESQDPEPHRHVCIFKTPRFVSAPHKTLAQCLRIAKAASALATGASSLRPTTSTAQKQAPQQAFNALLFRNPRFGLTIDELNAALATHLSTSSRTGPALTYTTSFLPSSEEVLIKATPVLTAAAVATSLAPTPQEVESTLSKLKVAVAQTVSRLGLAGAVSLCHVDTVSGQYVITRREDQAAGGDASGWNAVASRGSWKKVARMRAPPQQTVASGFVALRKLELKKEKKEEAEPARPQEKEKEKEAEAETVVDDWLAAAEEEEEKGKTDGSENGSRGSASETGLAENGENDSTAATVEKAEGGEEQDETKQQESKQVEQDTAASVAVDV
jgi:transcriptional repressor NF-X1